MGARVLQERDKLNNPTRDELVDAIRKQFSLVLRREPGAKEMSDYLELVRDSIKLAGNAKGLRQMLSTVILESECTPFPKHGQ